MRRFNDPEGYPWDVVVGRESWGNLYALFIPARHDRADDVRKALLHAAGYEEAQHELDELDDDTLRALFRAAEPR
jgi:hypothetical protein